MHIEAKNYFELIVEPTCQDYFAHPWDFRRAVLAIIVTSHMTDYYVMERYRGDESRKAMGDALTEERQRLITEFPDLERITDAADAAKHGRLASLKTRPRHVGSADQLRVSPSIFSAPWGHGSFAEAADVFVRSDTGSNFSARLHLSSAIAFWRGKLA